MYENFYGLKEKPFDLHPDPDYLYMSQIHENAYTHLEYAIRENKGFVVITGEIGSGKTTLINFLLTRVTQDMEVGLISNTSLSPEQFITVLCEEFEVPLSRSDTDKSKLIGRFHEFLLDRFAKGKRVVLIIDEAQNLSIETLEEIRLLSNLEAEKHHLMQTILVGQPELKNKLLSRQLEQFAQRVTVHCHLEGLNREEVEKYIHYRLKVAGANHRDIFTPDAIDAIYRHSRGIPRLINILCDTALVFGYADLLPHVNRDVIEAVVQSRKAGGLFVEGGDKGGAGTSSRPGPQGSEPRRHVSGPDLAAIEKRMASLEALIARLDAKIDQMIENRGKRDTFTAELFKMLQESMESRRRLIIGYTKLKQRIERPPSQAETPVSSDNRSRANLGWGWFVVILAAATAIMVMWHTFVSPLF